MQDTAESLQQYLKSIHVSVDSIMFIICEHVLLLKKLSQLPSHYITIQVLGSQVFCNTLYSIILINTESTSCYTHAYVGDTQLHNCSSQLLRVAVCLQRLSRCFLMPLLSSRLRGYSLPVDITVGTLLILCTCRASHKTEKVLL